jgi:trehalose synthase-fused probable maltokinase
MIIELKDKEVSNLIRDAVCRVPFERHVLPEFLMARRWYASKEDTAPAVTIEKSVPIPDLPEAMALFLSIKSHDGAVKSYFVPILAIWEGPRPHTGVVCELRAGAATGWLVDGFSDDCFVRALLEGIRRAGPSETGTGLVFCRSPGFNPGSSFAHSDIRRSGAEQSNTSVTAEDVILKAFRKLEPGVHPELEVGSYLTQVAGFRNVPKLLGSVEYVCPSTEGRTALCVLQGLIRHGKDGWEHVTDRFNRISNEGTAHQEGDRELLLLAEKLGKRTAELHQAFGAATGDPPFAPEPVSDNWLSQWKEDLLRSVASVFESVARQVNGVSDASALANRLLAQKSELADRITTLLPESTKAKRTRLHGDFHLGQVIVTAEDVYIVDFEGEPMRSLTERRGKFLPLRDVAGMLRSLDYACAAATRDTNHPAETSSSVRELTGRMQSAFLLAYKEAIAGCISFPEDLTQANDSLELSLIEKVLYEVGYEIANRPALVDIPIAGLLSLINGNICKFGAGVVKV